MKNNFTKILFVIFIAIGILGFLGQAKAVVDPLVVEFETTPLFKEANFLPGEGVSRWVKVTNNSGAVQGIATQPLNITDPNHLGGVLNLEIKEGAKICYSNSLSNFFNGGEVSFFPLCPKLPPSTTTQYDFTVSFYSGAQNTFQGKSLGFDILIGFQGTEGGILPGAGSSSGGGGGGWLPPGLTIQNETNVQATINSVTITWDTSYPATSQVIYALADGIESHALNLSDNVGIGGMPPKYGYARTTPETNISPKVTFHTVTITGLTSGTTYYFRSVSHASLAISTEHSFTTLGGKVNVLGAAPSVSVAVTAPLVNVPVEKSGQPTTEQPIEQPVAQTATQNPLAATIGGFLTLGTGSVWLGVIVGLIILAIIAYAIYALVQRKRKNLGNISGDIK